MLFLPPNSLPSCSRNALLYRSDANRQLIRRGERVKQRRTRRPREQTDERVEKSKRIVLATTYELLTKSGLSGVSVDEVSRRSGVAKTTIYRHWPSREALLLDACSQFREKPQAPDTGSFKRDLEALVSGVAVRLQQPWSTVMP